MIRIHYLQHDDFEDLAYIGEWADLKGYPVSYTRMDLGETLPDIENYDWLIVMGGKMGVYESEKYPWIQHELNLIRLSIAARKIVIGICLGSQMIAAALGSNVYVNQLPEIGFYPVLFNDQAANDPVFRYFGRECMVLHVHNDTFDLPEGAVLMASSAATRHQAFRYRQNVFAFQFHFEVTTERTLTFVREAISGQEEGRWIQKAEDTIAMSPVCEVNNAIFGQVLDAVEYEFSLLIS